MLSVTRTMTQPAGQEMNFYACGRSRFEKHVVVDRASLLFDFLGCIKTGRQTGGVIIKIITDDHADLGLCSLVIAPLAEPQAAELQFAVAL